MKWGGSFKTRQKRSQWHGGANTTLPGKKLSFARRVFYLASISPGSHAILFCSCKFAEIRESFRHAESDCAMPWAMRLTTALGSETPQTRRRKSGSSAGAAYTSHDWSATVLLISTKSVLIVVRDIPTTLETVIMPPCPILSASAAAYIRTEVSSSRPQSALYLASVVITALMTQRRELKAKYIL